LISRNSGQSVPFKKDWRAQGNRRIALPRITIGMQTVAAAKRQKQAAMPAVEGGEIHLNGLFNPLLSGKRLAHPVNRARRRLAFSLAGRALEECGDFPQLLAEFPFSRHSYLSRASGLAAYSSGASIHFTTEACAQQAASSTGFALE